MKFKRYFDDEFDEEFTSPQNRSRHYNKHISQAQEYDMTEEEYEKYSEDLMKTPCDYKTILGYKAIDKDNGLPCYVKYNKDTEFMTVYNEKGKTITSFRRPYRDFIGKMYDANQRYEYVDEIPRGK